MNFLVSLFASAASSPIVTKLLVPALAQALTGLFERLSKRFDTNSAKAALAHAETAEELRAASQKIKAAMDRRASK